MKKTLVILGAFPNTERVISNLHKAIDAFPIDKYDIALSTHYPIPLELQEKVKYVLYDSRNDIRKSGSSILWYSYPEFYMQRVTKVGNNVSYAVYRLIVNMLYMLKNDYNDFYYWEGDGIISKDDLEKFENMKTDCINNNKLATFFTDNSTFIYTICFYSNIKFFLNNIHFFSKMEDFYEICDTLKENSIEHYLYSCFSKEHLNKDIFFKNDNPLLFFSNSKMNNTTFILEKNYGNDYLISIIKNKNTNKIVLFYENKSNGSDLLENSIYLDDTLITTINPNLKFCWYEIFPTNNIFNIYVNKKLHDTYNIDEILNDNESFIEFKNNI